MHRLGAMPHSYSGLDPAQDIQEIAAARGLHPDVGLLTAVDLSQVRNATVSCDDVTAIAVRLAAPKADEMKTVLKAIAGLGAVTGSVTRDLHTAAPDPTGGEK